MSEMHRERDSQPAKTDTHTLTSSTESVCGVWNSVHVALTMVWGTGAKLGAGCNAVTGCGGDCTEGVVRPVGTGLPVVWTSWVSLPSCCSCCSEQLVSCTTDVSPNTNSRFASLTRVHSVLACNNRGWGWLARQCSSRAYGTPWLPVGSLA